MVFLLFTRPLVLHPPPTLCMGQWLNPVTVMMQQQQLRTQFVESPPAWLVVAHCRT